MGLLSLSRVPVQEEESPENLTLKVRLIAGQGESETPLLEGKHKFLRGDPGEEKGVTLKNTRPDMHAC